MEIITISEDLHELKDFQKKIVLEHEKVKALVKEIDPKKDKKNLSQLKKLIQSLELTLLKIKPMYDLKVGMWVKKHSSNTPGQIVELRIVNKTFEAQVKWWSSKVSVPELPSNLIQVEDEDLEYIWTGDKFPKLIRKIDGFECQDLSILQQQLEKVINLSEKTSQDSFNHLTLTQQKIYLTKRIKYLTKESSLVQNQFIENKSDREFIEKPQITIIAIDKIRKDGGTQQRERLHHETVTEYAEAIEAGDKFPPVKVIYDGADYWLYDGFHTIEAAYSIGKVEIEAQVKQGLLRDAILESVGVNACHGLRRNNATKRRAVITLLEDKEWSQWSEREIARKCKVSQPLVSKLRKEFCICNDDKKIITDNIISDNHKKYKDKYGNTSKMNTSNIGQSSNTINDKKIITGDIPSDNKQNDKNIDSTSESFVLNEENKDIDSTEVTGYIPSDNLQNHKDTYKTPDSKQATSQIEFLPYQLVQLKLSCFDGVSEKLKLLNHSYGLVTSWQRLQRQNLWSTFS